MSEHTPGPWRWELNMQSKSVHLVGGRPKFDLTIIDFERWGMGGATMSLRDTAHDGMNIMHKLHERPDWIAPFAGREHHKKWLQNVVHPDARLIAAAPDLLFALQCCIGSLSAVSPGGYEDPDVLRGKAAVAKALGEQS